MSEQAGAPITLESLVEDLAVRFGRVERAILGDPSVGHHGLVARMERVENEHAEVPTAHSEMDKARIGGDKRAHEHIEQVESRLGDQIAGLERKVDNLRWTVTGASAAVVGAATWLFYAAT